MEEQSYIKPKKLSKGDTIGLIAPASFITQEQLDKSIKTIEDLGLKTYYSDTILSQNGYLAGTDKQRAGDIMDMFMNEKIKGILCVRGGYGVARILPMLDFDIIKNNPKPIIGYSDITVLLQAVHKKTGMVCFHGPMGISQFSPYTFANFYNVLISAEDEFLPVYTDILKDKTDDYPSYNPYVIRPGKAEGILTGGNLSLITSMIGTEYEIETEGRILFLEEIGEEPYRIDRMLTQLLLAGKFKNVAGIALGIFKDCQTKSPAQNSLTLREVLTDRLYGIGVPVYYGLPAGHIPFNSTLPIGIKARIDAENMVLTLDEKGVSEEDE